MNIEYSLYRTLQFRVLQIFVSVIYLSAKDTRIKKEWLYYPLFAGNRQKT